MKRLPLLLALFALVVSAADVTGKWVRSADPTTGAVERTFAFKVDGDKLTGETTSSVTGKSTITNGEVHGDKVSFDITITVPGKVTEWHFTGIVKGKQMRLRGKLRGKPEDGFRQDYIVVKAS